MKYLNPNIDTVRVPDAEFGTRVGQVVDVTDEGVAVRLGWRQVDNHRSEPVVEIFDPDVVEKIYSSFYPGHGCDSFSSSGRYCELPEGHDWDTPWADREHMIHFDTGTEFRWTHAKQMKQHRRDSSRFD